MLNFVSEESLKFMRKFLHNQEQNLTLLNAKLSQFDHAGLTLVKMVK
jgi:hypothetical protein